MKLSGLQITYYGHSTFGFVTPSGKHVLVDPFLKDNPRCPKEMKNVDECDVMLITHGHSDHIADALDVAGRTGCTVIGMYELVAWLGSKGLKKGSGMNKGGTQTIAEMRITMVHADHSSGIDDGGQRVYGAEPCGYVIEFENGVKVYYAGDTAVFGDMHIIHELYGPQICMLPIGDFYTMGPREAAYACKLLRPKLVIPMHYKTFPALVGTPAELKSLVEGMGVDVVEMEPGETLK